MRVFQHSYRCRSGERCNLSRWYVEVRDSRGVPRKVPAFTDKEASQEFGRKLQLLAERKGSYAPLGPELLRWIEDLPAKTLVRLARMRLLDPARLAAANPLSTHLEDFCDALRPGRNKRHVD